MADSELAELIRPLRLAAIAWRLFCPSIILGAVVLTASWLSLVAGALFSERGRRVLEFIAKLGLTSPLLLWAVQASVGMVLTLEGNWALFSGAYLPLGFWPLLLSHSFALFAVAILGFGAEWLNRRNGFQDLRCLPGAVFAIAVAWADWVFVAFLTTPLYR